MFKNNHNQHDMVYFGNSRKWFFPAFIIIIVFFIYIFHFIWNNFLKRPSFREQAVSNEPGPDPYPSDWAWMQRTFPYWKADANSYRTEMKRAQKMRAATSQLEMVPMDFAGPTNIGGRITDIEFDPIHPNVVYAGAATGGVFKSIDMGVSWLPVFDSQANLSIGDIAVDPVNSNIVYVGTGEANGGHNNFPGGGIYKSVNGGLSWQSIGLENTVSIGRILIDPSNPQRIFVAAVGSYFAPNPERGVYRSEDAGMTWEKVLFISDSSGAIDLIMDPEKSTRLMAAMWERVRRPNFSHLYGASSGLYRSFDGGDKWEYLGPMNGLPDPARTKVGRIGLSLSASHPDMVYALYTDGSSYFGLYRSFDFGENWSDVDSSKTLKDGFGGFSWYFGQLRIHPVNPEIIYVMDVSFMRSIDGSQTWPIVYGYGGSPAGFHVDHHALAFHPDNPDHLIEGNDGGINISTDAGLSWSKVADLPVTQFYEIGLDYQNPQRLYGGTQDNGTLRTKTGALNDWDQIFSNDGFYVNVDFIDPDIIYAESQFGLLGKSIDGGVSFFQVLSGINQVEPTNWSTPVVMDPNDHLVLYYGTNRIYRTSDGASSWVPVSGDLTAGISGTRLGTITTIAVSPVNSSIIWAGTDDSHIWVTSDYGESWTDVSASLPYRWVTRVVPDPLNQDIAYVTFSGLKWVDPQPHVFRTENLGQSWIDISSNLPDAPINALAVNPLNTHNLFVGTDLGAYYSLDYGESWRYISQNLPMVSVYDMKIHPVENYLAIGTHGRSMYKVDLSIFSEIDETQSPRVVESFQLKQNYPNPFNSSTVIPYTLYYKCDITLNIYNSRGQHVGILFHDSQNAGNYQISWDGKDRAGNSVSSGIYLYELSDASSKQARKMLIIK
jgi:photosystem II stability/assembly factor-like uncharacterized protein